MQLSFEKTSGKGDAAWIEMRSLHSDRKNAFKTKRVDKFVGQIGVSLILCVFLLRIDRYVLTML